MEPLTHDWDRQTGLCRVCAMFYLGVPPAEYCPARVTAEFVALATASGLDFTMQAGAAGNPVLATTRPDGTTLSISVGHREAGGCDQHGLAHIVVSLKTGGWIAGISDREPRAILQAVHRQLNVLYTRSM